MISNHVFSRMFVGALACLAWTGGARADVKLHALFSDHMVLQQDKPVMVWGWADDGEEVTVEVGPRKASTKAKEGRWMVKLRKLDAGGPWEMKVTGKNQITLRDVLVGEVWVASGQSNMEWPMSRTKGAEEAIARASHPRLRLFTVPKKKATEPRDNVEGAWTECDPGSVKSFSAVGYYFGRDLQQALDVPVGIIHTSWGGSPAEVWMSHDWLADNPEYQKDILNAYQDASRRYQEALDRFKKEKAAAEAEGKEFNKNGPRAPWRPAELYNGMIASIIPYTIQGAIWYQGESNAGRAWQYRRLFADMILNWRHDWDQGKFPFLLVQLAPWDKNRRRSLEEITAEPTESDWAELREAQLLATQNLPNVGMAVITDAGDKDDIHPQDKEPVGARLARAALGIAYDKDIVYSGPVYKKMKVEDGKVVLTFDHAGGGLEARGGDLTGFAIAGEDKRFVWAEAKITGEDQVVVSSPEVKEPVAVRYGWSDFPVVNLYNQEGLPATPFRTDDFHMVTKKD